MFGAWRNRLGAIATAGGAGAVLVTAALLKPSAAGHGTHTQLGLPDCLWAQTFGKPCGTCGMTTAFSHAANAEFGAAFATQPFGAGLAIVTAAVFWGGVHGAATGAPLERVFGPLLRGRWLLVLLVAFLGAWGYTFVRWEG